MKTSTKTVISINNISKVYEGPPPVRALDGVSLEVEEGDFVAIVGQSGSGKTSSLINLKTESGDRPGILMLLLKIYILIHLF